MAEQGGFTEQRFQGTQFVLKGWLKRGRDLHAPLRVYIEGDGRAWIGQYTISPDPTPTEPVGFRLAASDPSAAPILYLARPGQYLTREELVRCHYSYWTDARFALEVVADMNRAVDDAKKRAGAQTVALFGYSGGGAIAVLMAARRDDVVFLGSIAGNLDHAYWTAMHAVSPLSRSLNPIDEVSRLAALPQLHIAGSNDTIIPPTISRRYQQASGSPLVRTATIPAMEHESAWEHVWPAVLAKNWK